MSINNKNGLPTIIRVVARVVSFCVTGFLLLASVVNLNYGKMGTAEFVVLISFGTALAGCVISWWREWVSGILLVVTGVALVTGARTHLTPWWLGVGFLPLVAGSLFLLSWWLLRRAS